MKHASKSCGFRIAFKDDLKVFKLVNHPTKPYYRKYKNPVKDGLSLADLLSMKIKEIEARTFHNLNTRVFT